MSETSGTQNTLSQQIPNSPYSEDIKKAKLGEKYLFDYPQDSVWTAHKSYEQLSRFSHTEFKQTDLLSVLTLVISC